jgi:serine/threonine protein kinase
MVYLETNKIVHRDISLRNLLVRQPDGEYFIKIADFGLRCKMEKEYYRGEDQQLPIRWTAPEALEFSKFTHKSDVWSFGIMLWELFSLGRR